MRGERRKGIRRERNETRTLDSIDEIMIKFIFIIFLRSKLKKKYGRFINSV